MRKVVLISGSSRGIGAATARLLAKKSYDICVNYKKNENEANLLVKQLKESGVKAISIQADVSKENDVLRLFSTIDNELGIISSLVNNAGILLPQTTVENMTADRINKILTTNAKYGTKIHKLLIWYRLLYPVRPIG